MLSCNIDIELRSAEEESWLKSKFLEFYCRCVDASAAGDDVVARALFFWFNHGLDDALCAFCDWRDDGMHLNYTVKSQIKVTIAGEDRGQ